MWWKYNYISSQLCEIDLTHALKGSTLPLSAAISAIQHITNSFPPPYNIMVSGGVDSQAMLYAWKMSGASFTAYTSVYNNGLNEHDLVQLFQFSKIHNIHIEHIEFNLMDYLVNEHDMYAHNTRCSSPQITAHMAMSSKLPGTSIFSGNAIDPGGAALNYVTLGLYRYSLLPGKNIVPYFFLSTPELAYSLLEYYRYAPRTAMPYEFKVNAYHYAGYPVLPQETKYTGFEVVKDYFNKHYRHLVTPQTRLKYGNKPSKNVFDLLYRYPYEDIFENPRIRYKLNT